ncbi:MAG: nitroreductase family protein [Planctomycetota bacterium]
MDLFEAIEKRASVRSFSPCDITINELRQIVDAGHRAPSGCNYQPWEFIVVTDKNEVKELGQVQSCIGEASAAIAVVADPDASEYWKEDASAAIENMLLAITALGYASLWVEGYVFKNEAVARKILNIPDDKTLLALLPVGRNREAAQADKKPLSEITHINRYGEGSL